MNIDAKNKIPVTTEAKPVLAPASTPDADSIKVVTVLVPVIEPTQVASESDNNARFIPGILSFSSNIPAFLAVPYKVPMVSNISTIQKEIIVIMAEKTPISNKFLKSNFRKVVWNISENGGSHVAVVKDINGFFPNMKEPIQ